MGKFIILVSNYNSILKISCSTNISECFKRFFIFLPKKFEKILCENFNIFKNQLISVKVAKVNYNITKSLLYSW